jgi:hypothetical protein
LFVFSLRHPTIIVVFLFLTGPLRHLRLVSGDPFV